MLASRPQLRGSALVVAVAGAVGCSSENPSVSCPAVSLTCPATPPDAGSACPAGAVGTCEYGDDPLFSCDSAASCDQGTWSVSSTPIGNTCPTTLEPGCPSSFAEAMAGFPCPSLRMRFTCLYPEGKCQCGGVILLTCTVPSAGCPATRPRAGTPCSGDCPTWGDGFCDGQSMNCTCGVWHPVSCVD